MKESQAGGIRPADIRNGQPARSRLISERVVPLNGAIPRVLVVDDTPGALDAMLALLSVEGMEVRGATSGIEAIEIVGTWVPHVVVLDIHMVEYDGFAVASILRGLNSTSNVAIIATTGYELTELNALGSLEHFDAVFQKGEDGARLTSLIRIVVGETRPDDPPGL